MRRMLGDLGHDVQSSLFTICDYNHKDREVNLKGLLRANEDRQVIDNQEQEHDANVPS